MNKRNGILALLLVLCAVVSSNVAFAGTPTWTLLGPGPAFSAGPEARGFHGSTIVYSSHSNRLVLFGGRSTNKLNLNDVWVLTNANGTGGAPNWTNYIANGKPGSPGARSGHSAVYDAANDRMVVFGGCSGYCQPTLNDVWVLTNASGAYGTPTWVKLSPSGTPPAGRTRAIAVYDPNSNRMILFAGQNGSGSGGTYSDVWVLTNANGLGGIPAWIQLHPPAAPLSGLYGASGVYDSTDNVLTVFGGTTATGALTNSVWILYNANGANGTPVWLQLPVSGAPAARSFHTSSYDATNNRMTIFGGSGTTSSYSDVWVLVNANGYGVSSWVKLSPTGKILPTGRNSHAGVYDPVNNIMMTFGGDNADAWFLGPWVLSDANGL